MIIGALPFPIVIVPMTISLAKASFNDSSREREGAYEAKLVESCHTPKTLNGCLSGARFVSSQLSADALGMLLDRIHIAHLPGGAHGHA